MLRDKKNRITLIYLILFSLFINLLSGCSGCSKSGRKIPGDNDTIYCRSSDGWEQRAQGSGLKADG
jgi:hypothetical protein